MTAPADGPAAGALRYARGCVFAGAAAWLAAVAHVGGGGAAPSAVSMVLVGALCAALGVQLSARRRGFARVVATLAPVQLVAHTLFVIFGEPTSGTLHGGHHAALTQAHEATAPMPGDHLLLTHALALLVSAVLLAYGERAVWRLAGRLSAVLVLVRTTRGTVAASARLPVCSAYEVMPVWVGPRGIASRRGPPAASFGF